MRLQIAMLTLLSGIFARRDAMFDMRKITSVLVCEHQAPTPEPVEEPELPERLPEPMDEPPVPDHNPSGT